ncbi:penicillin-binding protein 2 [Alkalibaculum bacchi]|uniref:Penicillin-binding protein 2 n=1 Tax=Alkalibaculum bacchi TaxID=645887 RepID=A0A366IHS7_9FIRM|nr:penicillin-binding transpeptidase domain-containing protein [Alkalibaculum bacchi]RBP70064.1 penicillin-binding protein 2 [Alkalibaculum bacchi]
MIVNKNKYRFIFLFVFLILLITIFLFRLAYLQIISGEQYAQMAENKMVQKITETAPRGSIVTGDGYEIAKSKVGYSVELIYSNIEDGQENQVLLQLYNLLEKNEEEFEDKFPILIEKGSIFFTYEKEEKEWKEKHEIPRNATAEEALIILRDKYNVKDEISNEVALEAIEKVHMNANLPLSIRDGDIIFGYETKELQWKKDFGFKKEEYDYSAEKSLQKLRKMYEIDETLSNEDARKILVFRQMVKAQGFRSWEPIQVARNIKLETVFEIDSRVHELSGVSVASNPVREYPFQNLASHVLGYIGKVSEKDVEDGSYKMRDLKGISGIESSFEEYLKGEDGQRFAVTDYKGIAQNDPTQEVQDPIPGDDVYLTLDYDLQRVAEESLENQIKKIQKTNAPNAKSGAVVALNVKTGAVLALASYPDYNPNLFTNGISSEDWNKLNVLVNDPLYPKPLYNNATLSALQPGSVFKPLMAAAGLQEGVITKHSTIYCGRVYGRFPQFTCLGAHGAETVREALRDSCNIFFYETGYRLGIDNIEKYAKEFGIGQKTGLEISESSGYLATKTDKVQIRTYSTSDYIRKNVGIKGNAIITNEDGTEQAVYKSYAIARELYTQITPDKYEYDSISQLYNRIFEEVTAIMAKYNVKDNVYLQNITRQIMDSRWVTTDTINASIGQGGNSTTPIQMANFLATLVNGGIRREPYLVDKIVDSNGKVTYEHKEKILNKVNVDEGYIDEIKKGMKDVMLQGSGRSGFLGFDHNGIGVGGKTGTAQYGSEKIDNTGWFMAFAPYDDPEIAVVTMIIQGDTSINSVPVARDVIDAYFYNNYTFEEAQEMKKKEEEPKKENDEEEKAEVDQQEKDE